MKVIPVLPKIVDEQHIFTFSFWFEDQLRNGMNYQNELFCQIGSFDIQHKVQVYQLSCKLAYQGVNLVITHSETRCRLWGGLRHEMVQQFLMNPLNLNLPASLQTS